MARRRSSRGALGPLAAAARPFVLLAGLLLAWAGLDPALIDPPRFLTLAPERIDERFTRCGPGRGHACVIDGDTFKLGKRKIRIVGIDAPEIHGQCPAETVLAERATRKLQTLLNQGPFTMTGRVGDMQDRYGRDLRTIERVRRDGTVQSFADEMRQAGLAHRYTGFKWGWC